jgi:YfiH family protein
MIIRPKIFSQFSEIIAAQSTREGGVSPVPYGMNLSSHVGDEPDNVKTNRELFFNSAGVPGVARVVYQNQIHSANVNSVSGNEGIVPKSDGLITTDKNVFLAVSIADCTPVLIYASDVKAIVLAGVRRLKELGAKPENMFAFIGACASQSKYEVGFEVATLFEKKHLIERADGKFLLDVREANHEQLLRSNVPASQIEVSDRCTISDDRLHSYRRDASRSGRMLAIIGRV